MAEVMGSFVVYLYEICNLSFPFTIDDMRIHSFFILYRLFTSCALDNGFLNEKHGTE